MLGAEFIIAAGESMNDRRLSPDEVARFHGDGYLLKPALFDAEEVALMRQALANDAGIGDQRNTMAMHDADGSVTTTVLWTDPGDDLFGAIARCERVVDAAERLLGGEVYHYHSKLTLKAPETGGAWNWHQDYGYWYFNGNLFPDMLSVFIAIDPATRENGCIQVIRGSARMGRLDHELVGGQLTADPERVAHAIERLEVVSCEMAAGDALFLHCNTLHGSSKNVSRQSRNVLLCCYNAARNDPYKDHHMPRYTPLEKLPDSAVKERGGIHAGTARRFMRPEDHPDDQASLTTPDYRLTGASLVLPAGGTTRRRSRAKYRCEVAAKLGTQGRDRAGATGIREAAGIIPMPQSAPMTAKAGSMDASSDTPQEKDQLRFVICGAEGGRQIHLARPIAGRGAGRAPGQPTGG